MSKNQMHEDYEKDAEDGKEWLEYNNKSVHCHHVCKVEGGDMACELSQTVLNKTTPSLPTHNASKTNRTPSSPSITQYLKKMEDSIV